ncbi:PAS domain-containing sensor histidine kinase [Roseivirga echinicomitans]|uniref:histidine kinase n=1 Tax=Roseivirga echinicomitans TaxID=296218 RepID=A0A150XJJ3_9BACT|nr:PAS domain-containing sensor histidine kinase [Roseivirga echinicomitans]KYG78842.1 PAS domain-containing sensor histidine kinase [Roseivirga echinicomitans]
MNKLRLNSDYFFKLSPDLLCIAGFDGFFKRINPAVSNLLGYTEEELMSRPIDDFIHPSDQNITSQYRENIKKGNPLLNYENRYIKKNGEIVWLAWTSMPLNDESLVYAIAKDITHKKKLEEERNALLANLSVMNKKLKDLSFTTSHDLRGPVNNLFGILHLLDTSEIKNPETLHLIELLKTTSEKLEVKMNRHLDALSENAKVSVKIEDVSLTEVLKSVQDSIATLIDNSKVIFQVDFTAFQTISFNKDYLESIFLNLITNSIKYARPDTLPIISIQSKMVNEVKRLVFIDNGIGFNKDEVKDRIFGLSQTFNTRPESKGIGLYLVHTHMTNLGGHISVESKINEGTEFTLSFKN